MSDIKVPEDAIAAIERETEQGGVVVDILPPPRFREEIAPTGTRHTLELPSATVAAGKRTTISMFLADPSFVREICWVPGFKLERLLIGSKDFGDGRGKVDDRRYTEHRVLKHDSVQLMVLNLSKEDRVFSGKIAIEVSHVIASTEYSCGLGEEDTSPQVEIPGCTP